MEASVAKILVVDDEPNIREVVGLYLRGAGHEVVSATDGEEALRVFGESEPDLVVLDFFMPRWDGSKAAEFIRERCPRSKIIAFSAVLQEPPHWADDFLVKNDVMELIPLAEQMAPAA